MIFFYRVLQSILTVGSLKEGLGFRVDLVRVIASGCETRFEVLEELGADEVGAIGGRVHGRAGELLRGKRPFNLRKTFLGIAVSVRDAVLLRRPFQLTHSNHEFQIPSDCCLEDACDLLFPAACPGAHLD